MTAVPPLARVPIDPLAPAASKCTAVGPFLRSLLARWYWVIIAFAASRLLIYILYRLSRMIMVRGEHWEREILGVLTQDGAARYLEIAAQGYGRAKGGGPRLGIFPVYPKVVDFFSGIFGSEALAGVVISNVMLLAAGLLLWELVHFEFKSARISRAAVALLMFGPVSFFFSCAYPEAMFLVLVLGAFLAAVKGRWLIASLCGMVASATSVIGIFVLLPLLHLYLSARKSERLEAGGSRKLAGLFLALVPLGFVGFVAFAEAQFGKSSGPYENAEIWHSGFLFPWQLPAALGNLPPFFSYFTAIVLGAAALLWFSAFQFKMRPAYLIYSALLIAVCACNSNLPALARVMSLAFPLYVSAALVVDRFRWSYELLLTASCTGLAFCTIMYANGHWAR